MVPQHIAQYEIEHQLGEGGSGRVYLALDAPARRKVALKLIWLAGADAEMVEAEKRGAQLQQEVARRSSQVPLVYEVGTAEGFFFIAMELVPGEDLHHIIARQAPLPETQAATIAHNLCLALEVFHSTAIGEGDVQPLIHGDLSPRNLRLQGKTAIRILDFGLAKRLARGKARTELLFATAEYAPPERLLEGAVDPNSDLWAVAAMLYEMVTGVVPFPGSNLEELLRRLQSGDPAPLPPSLSPRLKGILAKALALDPAARYASATELRAALGALVRGEEDLGRTRRTGVRGSANSAPTLESAPGLAAAASKPPTNAHPPRFRKQQGDPSHRDPLLPRWVKWLAGGLFASILGLQSLALAKGNALDRSLPPTDDSQLLAAVRSYSWVRPCDVLGLNRGKEKRLRDHILMTADRTLARARAGLSSGEPEYARAWELLNFSVSLDPLALDARARRDLLHARRLVEVAKAEQGTARISRLDQAKAILSEQERYPMDGAEHLFLLIEVLLEEDEAAGLAAPLETALNIVRLRRLSPEPAERRILSLGYERLGLLLERKARGEKARQQRLLILQRAREALTTGENYCTELPESESSCKSHFKAHLERIREAMAALGVLI